MELSAIIESAEKQYKQILEGFFISFYKENLLPSHGLDHHRRVWNFSKELLEIIALESSDQSKLVPELIIACYLHDIGMSVDNGIKHGKHSRDLCQRFLIANNLPVNDFTNALEAVENHDNKDYSGNTIQNDLLRILSISDDLDAFGIPGIYRYSEIYLMRGIGFEYLGDRIIENAAKRFDNFLKAPGLTGEFIEKHTLRYNILIDFFNNYNKQLIGHHFNTGKVEGFCGVVELISHMIENKTELSEICLNADKYKTDKVIRWFLLELENELKIK
jgi:hypothetical protein